MSYCARFLCIATMLCCAVVAPARAQTPDTGMFAAGADVGFLFPAEEFETTLTIDGYGEFYVTPRVGVRGMLAWASPGVDGRTEDHFRQARLLFNATYNWEFGAWHPYVTGGAGAYFVRLLRDDREDPDGETRGGINFGGGVEYFTTSVSAVKGELRFDRVSHPTGLPDASSVTLTIGFKRYF